MATAFRSRREAVGRPEDGLRIVLLAKFYRGLGDPTRLRILECLLEGEHTVGELVDLLGSPQGRVSSHLACLRWCGLVATRPVGRHVYYRVADPRVRELLALGKGMMTANAEHIFACLQIS
ncbi:MAG: winged helix-turn-helix transcriptional regulator [Armatimonadetes bacterium]|nr:winged helix-turn-helix transcriptional regulator [Armatimonadota bacterium]